MKISYNWLKQYVNVTYTPEKLSEILTDTGLEVEGLEKVEAIKGGLEGVFIGEVLTCEKHENADKLNVTTVDIGSGEPLQIVCGAPNVAAGQKVVVATVGCTLYPNPDDPFKIKKAKIRGVASAGMICAEDELGIGFSHDGIMVLDAGAKVGALASDYFNLENDYLIEIGLTPNRSDAMGHIGVARDVVAYMNTHERANEVLQLPDVSSFKVDSKTDNVAVSVADSKLCPRYAGLTITGLTIAPSPDWLKNALLFIGITPKNNVVDVTNYVLHELGTPLHAFDLRQVKGRIEVKCAKENDEFITLDEVKRKLSSEDLMITNGSENLCIAGVFGGLGSGVKDDTESVFLEAAYFNPVSIRKTAKRHGLNTDASFRFERGVDPNMIDYALKRAALLIKEVAGGQISMEPVDLYPNEIVPANVTFSYERCNKLIGNSIPKEEVKTILSNLDINIIKEDGDSLILEIPTYRVDVTREADVIEEVLRIYGFNNVTLPEKFNLSLPKSNDRTPEKSQQIISEFLAANGYFEMMNNSLTRESYVSEFGSDLLSESHNVAMLNPLSNELGVMRQSLVFQILESLVHNQNRQQQDVKLFEFGKIYQKFDSKYQENKRLLIVLSGNRFQESWNTTEETVTYFHLKGIIEAILRRLGLDQLLSYKALKKSVLSEGEQLYILKQSIGEIGFIGNALKKSFGIKNDLVVANLDWDAICSALKMNKVVFKELPKTFAVRRDFSLLLDEEVTFREIEAIAKSSDQKLLKSVGLFDVYEGKNLPKGKKSYAVSFTFQHNEQTLKDEQVEKIMSKIQTQLTEKLNAELR